MTTKQILERIALALEGNKERPVMNIEEAAEYLGVSRNHLDNLKSLYKVPFVRIGGRIAFRRKDLDQYMENQTVTGPETDPGRVPCKKNSLKK